MSSDREQFKTRLGFLLIAAGCAIGLGNVWRFPYITGMYGGALFVIIYLAFLLGVGMPLLTIELAIGRASRRSIARAYEVLEQPKKEAQPKRTKTHKAKKSKSKKVQDSQEMPSAKIRMSTRDLEEMENEPKSKSGMIINVILVVLVLLLIASLAATFYFITQIGA